MVKWVDPNWQVSSHDLTAVKIESRVESLLREKRSDSDLKPDSVISTSRALSAVLYDSCPDPVLVQAADCNTSRPRTIGSGFARPLPFRLQIHHLPNLYLK